MFPCSWIRSPGFIASRLHHRDHRRAGERHRSQRIMGSVRYSVVHALLRDGHRDGLARQLYGQQQQASATLRFRHHRPRPSNAVSSPPAPPRAPRSSHFALLFVDHCLTHRRHLSPAASRVVELSAFVRRRQAPGGRSSSRSVWHQLHSPCPEHTDHQDCAETSREKPLFVPACVRKFLKV